MKIPIWHYEDKDQDTDDTTGNMTIEATIHEQKDRIVVTVESEDEGNLCEFWLDLEEAELLARQITINCRKGKA